MGPIRVWTNECMSLLITWPFLFQILDNALKLESRNVWQVNPCFALLSIDWYYSISQFLLGDLRHCQFIWINKTTFYLPCILWYITIILMKLNYHWNTIAHNVDDVWGICAIHFRWKKWRQQSKAWTNQRERRRKSVRGWCLILTNLNSWLRRRYIFNP